MHDASVVPLNSGGSIVVSSSSVVCDMKARPPTGESLPWFSAPPIKLVATRDGSERVPLRPRQRVSEPSSGGACERRSDDQSSQQQLVAFWPAQ